MPNGLVKTEKDIELLAQGGKILSEILKKTSALVKPGVSTGQLNEFAERTIIQAGGRPSFKGFGEKINPFPAALCVSVNDVIVHGIPSRSVILKEGDIISLDAGMEYKGLFTDTAVTVPVGRVNEKAARLIAAAKKCLEAAISAAKEGNTTGDIGYAIQSIAEAADFSVVRDLVGHGVGYSVHEEPQVPCYGKPGQGVRLVKGMALAIEPMLCENGWKILIDDDGWTIRTADGGLSAHYEHTVVIMTGGARALT